MFTLILTTDMTNLDKIGICGAGTDRFASLACFIWIYVSISCPITGVLAELWGLHWVGVDVVHSTCFTYLSVMTNDSSHSVIMVACLDCIAFVGIAVYCMELALGAEANGECLQAVSRQ